MTKSILYFDGGSRGNPGISGCGYVLYINTEKVSDGYRFISKNGTNNEAEYSGLIDGLKAAISLGITELEIRGDSKLVLQQIQNKWKVKAPNLKPFHQEATNLMKKFMESKIPGTTTGRNGIAENSKNLFKKLKFQHVPRSENKEADSLANQGMDESIDS